MFQPRLTTKQHLNHHRGSWGRSNNGSVSYLLYVACSSLWVFTHYSSISIWLRGICCEAFWLGCLLRVVLLTPVKVRCTLLALEYKSGVYVAWNSKIFPSETFDNVFSYQAKLQDRRLRQKTHATVTTLRGWLGVTFGQHGTWYPRWDQITRLQWYQQR